MASSSHKLLQVSLWINFVISVISVLIAILLIIFSLKKSTLFEYKAIHVVGYCLVILHCLAFILTKFIQIDYVTHKVLDFNFIMCQIQGLIHFISIISFLMFTSINNLIFFLGIIHKQKIMNKNIICILSISSISLPVIIVIILFLCGIHFEISDNKSCFILDFRGLVIFVLFFLFLYMFNFCLLIYFFYNRFSKDSFFKKESSCNIALNFAVLLTLAFLLFDCVKSLFIQRGGDFWNFTWFTFIRDLLECLTGLVLIISFQMKDDWEGCSWLCFRKKKQIVDQRYTEILDY